MLKDICQQSQTDLNGMVLAIDQSGPAGGVAAFGCAPGGDDSNRGPLGGSIETSGGKGASSTDDEDEAKDTMSASPAGIKISRLADDIMWTNADKLVVENASTMVVIDFGHETAVVRRTDVDTDAFVDAVSITSKSIANEVDKQVNEYPNMAHADETAERMGDILNLGQENAQNMIHSGEVKDGAMGLNENRDGSESILLTEHLATRARSQYQTEKDLKKQQEFKKFHS